MRVNARRNLSILPISPEGAHASAQTRHNYGPKAQTSHHNHLILPKHDVIEGPIAVDVVHSGRRGGDHRTKTGALGGVSRSDGSGTASGKAGGGEGDETRGGDGDRGRGDGEAREPEDGAEGGEGRGRGSRARARGGDGGDGGRHDSA